MLNPRIKSALVVLAASAGLGACTSLGSPYGGSGVSVGVGVGSPYGYGYGSPYGYGYGSPYGYGYGGHYGYSPAYYGGHPYFGWYDGFYYPGTGYWMYDPWGRQFQLTPRHRQHFGDMMRKFRERRGENAVVTSNFSGFRAKAKEGATITGVDLDAAARAEAARVQAAASADTASVRRVRGVRRQAVSERQQAQSEQRAARSEARTERQQAVRERVIERRRARRGGGG